MDHIADQLIASIKAKRSPIVVGLDPVYENIPQCIRAGHGSDLDGVVAATLDFGKLIIDAVASVAAAIKPQSAFYELYGWRGIKILEETITYAKAQGLIVIEDAKRGDIGNTSKAYAQAHLGSVVLDGATCGAICGAICGATCGAKGKTLVGALDNASDSSSNSSLAGAPDNTSDVRLLRESHSDFLTVAPFLGIDGVEPFIETAKASNRGVFVLVRTSNPASALIQSALTKNQRTVSQELAAYIAGVGEETAGKSGYSLLGAVVGATYPKEAKALRAMMPHAFLLVPGYGAQGASAQDVAGFFNSDGLGALISASRSIIFAYKSLPGSDSKSFSQEDFVQATAQAARKMRDDIYAVLEQSCQALLY